MHATLCICALTPQLATRTRLALVVHHREADKPTNTGKLAARCLARSSVTVYGERGQPTVMPGFPADEQPVLLYPGDEAVPIAELVGAVRPIVLVVPDGTWRQAGKLRRHLPELAALPCVRLPDTGGTQYRLRAEQRAGNLSTFEAIARALCILEGEAGPAVEAAMMAVFRVMVDRTLWFRGAIPSAQVTGGIPAAAVAYDPRGKHPPVRDQRAPGATTTKP